MSDRAVKLLVSVRDVSEALAALGGGADIIDVKEPLRGPMGMADPSVIEQVVTVVAGRAPVSVALGELADNPPIHLLPAGVTYAKIGLHGAGANWRALLARQFARNRRVQPVAVAYVDDPDGPSIADVYQWAVHRGAAAVLLDTMRKDGGDLFAHLGQERGAMPSDVDGTGGTGHSDCPWHLLASTRASRLACATRGVRVALAGSLTIDAIPRAIALGADIIAVRGAACRDNHRHAGIDVVRVRQLTAIIAAAASPVAVHAD